LFYRIDGITLRLSALRERREDIPILCEYFRERQNKRLRRQSRPLSEPTLHLISQWPWPGNIRELENWVIRQIVLGVQEALNLELSRQCATAGSMAGDEELGGHLKLASRKSARAAEQALILKHLAANSWNRRATAKDLNISYRSLLYKLREAGIPSSRRKENNHIPDQTQSDRKGEPNGSYSS
jgi:two-component system response regulator AtoC